MVKLAADFEGAMARVKAVAFSNEGADMSQFAALSAQAKQLGADTKYTAIEAAGAQENLLRANMSPEDVIKALPSVLNMAAAEGMGLEQAGAIIAKGLGGMNLGGELAPRLADILAYTSANSNTNIAMLGEAFKVAAPVLAGQGAKMEQVATYLGIMANKGFEGSEAGNAIASAVMRIAKPTAETTNYLRQLGVATVTRDGKMRELSDIMLALNKSMNDKHWGESQQLAAMSAIFGKNYGKQMMAFMAATAAGDTATLQNGINTQSEGRAEKMANINLDTLNGQLDILSSSWDGLRTTIGEIFSPYVRQGVEMLSSALSKVNNVMREFPLLGKTVTFAMTGAFGAAAVRRIWNIGSALLQLPGAYLETVRAAREASAVLGQTPSILSRISSMLGGLKSVILAHPVLAIGTLVAGAVALAIANWDKIKAWWDNFVIPNIWEPVVSWAEGTIARVRQLWDDFCNWLSSLNPFSSWQAPQVPAEVAQAGKQEVVAKYGTADLRPSYMKGYATGGIVARPQIAQVAEDGAEAIIPLTDKSRGIPLLQQAAEILGVQNFGQREQTVSTTNSSSTSNYTPTINITVNGAEETSESLAGKIAQAVRDTLNNIMNLEDRVSYA